MEQSDISDEVTISSTITAKEAAALIGVDPSTLARWTKDGKLTAFKLPNGRKRYRKDDVAGMLSEGTSTND
jgi:excisionase family DNA binding protein